MNLISNFNNKTILCNNRNESNEKNQTKQNKMWENPFYYFRVPYINKKGEEKIREIKIDVSLTAWSKEISPGYKNVLKSIIAPSSDYPIRHILDYGCGKFNSVNFILRYKKNITVVDFKEILEKYDYLEKKLENLKKTKNFQKMEFPNPFIGNQGRYDLGLLANVLPFMPVFLERLYVLQLLYQKIKNDKFLIWFAMKNPHNYRIREPYNKYHLGDGIWLRDETAEYKTFYKYHPPDYLNLIMYCSGFHLLRTFKVASNDSFLFKRTEHNLLSDIINDELLNKIRNYQMIISDDGVKKKSKIRGEITPYPENYILYNLLKICLDNIKPGQKSEGHPNKFKRIAAGILNFLFFNQIYDMEIEEKVDAGRSQIDVTMRPNDNEGFFKSLRKIHNIRCPVVFIEAKNKSGELDNVDYQQLFDRFGPKRGMFGILVCRQKINEKEILIQLAKRKDKNKGYAIVLDDKDLLSLLKLKLEDGEDPINQFFEKAVTKLLLT
ncbi:MAG: hypothetical protein ACFFAH_03635 [Promethearchaeota archaeon]